MLKILVVILALLAMLGKAIFPGIAPQNVADAMNETEILVERGGVLDEEALATFAPETTAQPVTQEPTPTAVLTQNLTGAPTVALTQNLTSATTTVPTHVPTKATSVAPTQTPTQAPIHQPTEGDITSGDYELPIIPVD